METEQTPEVSVVIPCYNVAAWVGDALDSVFIQKGVALEIIAVDDGSSDETVSVIADWISRHPEVAVQLICQPNAGACAARNQGLSAAKGSYVQFLDADDVLLPGKIRAQVDLLENCPEAAFVAGAFNRVSVDGKKTASYSAEPGFFSVFAGQAGITSANLFCRSSLNAIGGWKEDLGSSQEAELMFRLLMKSKHYVAHKELLTEVRERVSGRITQSNPVRRVENYLHVRLTMYDSFCDERPEEWEKAREDLDAFLFSTIALLNRLSPGVWKEYRSYLVKPALLKPVAGLSAVKIKLAGWVGYPLFFRIMSLLPKPVL
ncbi:MAG: glycosyltransferase family 2 protein [Cryomorphaceae bacterium]|nr:MAG: glycosyltransferase family 2 protein [Cryomorphaceae bacterium]